MAASDWRAFASGQFSFSNLSCVLALDILFSSIPLFYYTDLGYRHLDAATMSSTLSAYLPPSEGFLTKWLLFVNPSSLHPTTKS